LAPCLKNIVFFTSTAKSAIELLVSVCLDMKLPTHKRKVFMRLAMFCIIGLFWPGSGIFADNSPGKLAEPMPKSMLVPGTQLVVKSPLFNRREYREQFLIKFALERTSLSTWKLERVADYVLSWIVQHEERFKAIQRSRSLKELLIENRLGFEIGELLWAQPGNYSSRLLRFKHQRLRLFLVNHSDKCTGRWLIDGFDRVFEDTKVGDGVAIAPEADRAQAISWMNWLKAEIFRRCS
jgi:hypothetical protein